MKRAVPYVFVAALFLLMACNNLLTRGMFMDGLIYSSVADNLAHGRGSLWHLTYTLTNDAEFYGHPPLMMWMLAGWFMVFGTSMLTAKMYALLMVVLASVLMVAVWRRLGFDRRTGWLPLLMWMCISDVVLLSCNNFLESTMLVFVMASVWCMLRGGWWNVAGGVAVAMAFLTKGPTGLFTVVLPLLMWLFGLRKSTFWRMAADTAVVVVSAVLPMVLLCVAEPDAAYYLSRYLDTQVIGSLGLEGRSRFYIAGALFGRSAIVIAMAAVAVLVSLKLNDKPDGQHWRTAGMLFALALCGSLPMMISAKQYPHYLLADFPIMALATAVPAEPLARRFACYMESTAATVVAGLMLAGAVALNAMHAGQAGRDKVLIADMDAIVPLLGDGETVTIPDPLVFEYNLHGYYYFNRHVSLDQHGVHRHLLTTKELGTGEWGECGYNAVPLPTEKYMLYEKQ